MCYKSLGKDKDATNFEKYKLTKKEAKKIVKTARARVHMSIWTPNREKKISILELLK